MALVTYLMSMLLYFAIVLLDIVFVFIVVRCLVQRWPARWLIAFDTAGVQLVQGILGHVGRCLARAGGAPVRPEAALILSAIALMILRLMLSGLVVALQR